MNWLLRAGGIGPARVLPPPTPNYAAPAPRPGRIFRRPIAGGYTWSLQ